MEAPALAASSPTTDAVTDAFTNFPASFTHEDFSIFADGFTFDGGEGSGEGEGNGEGSGEGEVNSPYKPRKRPAEDEQQQREERTPRRVRRNIMQPFQDGGDNGDGDDNECLLSDILLIDSVVSPSPATKRFMQQIFYPDESVLLSDVVANMHNSTQSEVRLEWSFIEPWTIQHAMCEETVKSLIFDVDAQLKLNPRLLIVNLTDVQVRVVVVCGVWGECVGVNSA